MFDKVQNYIYRKKWDGKISALLKSRGMSMSDLDYANGPWAPKSGIEWTPENKELLENDKWWAIYFGRNLAFTERMTLDFNKNTNGQNILFFPRGKYADACQWWNEMNKRTVVNKKLNQILNQRLQ